MKKINKKLKFALVFLIGILFAFNFVSALDSYARSNPQYTSFDYTGSGDFENFNSEMCKEGQDFIIQVSPFGCTPAVVRSDLLEEQNVPVFCQLSATQINPLIKVEAIESISFTNKEISQGVSGVSFHPSRAALSVNQNINFQPILDNIGYVVINLKQNKNESSMPDFVEGNLTARISYDIINAYGIGEASFYLPEMEDSDWASKFVQYGFWDGRGYLRAESVGSDQATISIYSDRTTSSGLNSGNEKQKVSTVTLRKGETSPRVYLPNFDYCLGNFNLRLNYLEAPNTRARLNINGQIVEVVEDEKFLENHCWATNIEKQGLVQKADIHCNEDEGKKIFNFVISPKINLSINGTIKEVNVGDYLFPYGDEKYVYLAYAGTLNDSTRLEDLELYFAAIPENKKSLTGDEIKDASKLVNAYHFNGKEKESILGFIGGVGKSLIGSATNFYKFLVKGDSFDGFSYKEGQKKVFGEEIKIIGFAGPKDAVLSEKAKEYYQNALEDYDSLEKGFAGEDFDESGLEIYGENALYEKINLAESLGQKKTMVEFCKEFEENYPNSKKSVSAKCNNAYRLSSSTSQEMSVLINNRVKTISLENIYEPSKKEFSAEILIRKSDGTSETITLGKNQIVYLNQTSNDFIQLVSLEQDSATLKVSIKKENMQGAIDKISGDERTLKKDIPNSFSSSYNFVLKEVNFKQSAKVSVISNINNAWTESDFSFKVGIEKRSDLFKLSPEKTKDVIKSLDKNIKQWEEISNNLNIVVERMKTACLGTGIALNIKNLWNNRKGLGIARYNVMRNSGGWYEKCTDIVNDKSNKITSIEQCFLDNVKEIEKDVDKMYEVLNTQNDNIKNIQAEYTTKKLFSENVVNTTAFVEKYSKQVIEGLTKSNTLLVLNPRNSEEKITIDEMLNSLSSDAWEKNVYTIEQLRDIELYTNILNSDSSAELKKMANENLYYIFRDIKENSEDFEEAQKAKEESEKNGINTNFPPYTSGNKKSEIYEGAIAPDDKGIIKKGDEIQGISFEHVQYYVILKDAGDNKYTIKNVTLLDGTLTDLDNKIKNSYSYFEKFNELTYKNEIKNPEVEYYETEPYAGLPAIVPFDLKEGWYAATTATLPVFGGIKAYDDSGRVSSFWLCNVGENGIIEFNSGTEPDDRQMINLGTGQTYNQFAGLSSSKTTKLVNEAVQAIYDASNQHKSGISKARINGQNIPVGSPAVSIPDIQCQDFMSVRDCQILFNVCDPVICPSSRCDFGGSYPVKDVVQSGIIGSIALCLPNAKEGIYIPICLTGVKAGLDSLLSVETSYRDCLQKSLETGEMIGICDEIHSIYLCEFLWKQTLPLAKLAIPKLMGLVMGQSSSHGGGEYLGVADAWSNSEKAINYFTQYYAENSFKAFQLRSTEQVGTEVCKVAISASYPGGGNFFNSLIKADSPFQFNGNFEEISFTTATNPPISQYKVYYHIYAGQDSGAYYQVYLKSGSESSYYQDTAVRRPVASGYIARGDYASQTEDFTAPSGYKQMCIVVNGQEECGFQQVSTSFAVDYMKDQYIKEQATQKDIKTVKECVSGTASVYSALNMNIQSGIEEAINPALYNSGVIRICATDAPDAGTDPSSGTKSARWILVGSCGDSNVGCWLDTKSIENAVEVGWETSDKILEEVSKTYADVLRSEGDYLTDDEFVEKVKEIEDEGTSLLDKVKLSTEIINKVFLNNQKAKLFWLRGNAFGKLAKNYYMKQKEEEKEREDSEKLALERISSLSESPVFDVSNLFEDIKTFRYKDGESYFKVNVNTQDNAGSYWKRPLSLKLSEAVNLPAETSENEKIKGYSTEDKAFLKFLSSGYYGVVLKSLIDRTLEENERNLFQKILGIGKRKLTTDNVVMDSEGVFSVEQESTTTIYFKYFDNSWKWSPERDSLSIVEEGSSGNVEKVSSHWFEVPNINLDKTKWQGQTINENNILLIKSLEGKNLYEGAAIIFGEEYGKESLEERTFNEIDKNAFFVPDATDIKLSDTYKERYIPFSGLFEKYSNENLPIEWDLNDFKALLVAVAQKETSLGDGKRCGKKANELCEDWLMGYTGGADFNENYRGFEEQIKRASNTFKRAFEKSNTNYQICYNEKSLNDFVECVLSVYNTGEPPKSFLGILNNRGKVYAKEVIGYWGQWKEYFNFQESLIQKMTNPEKKESFSLESLGDLQIMDTISFSVLSYEPAFVVSDKTSVELSSSSLEEVIEFEFLTNLNKVLILDSPSLNVGVQQCVEKPAPLCVPLEESTIDSVFNLEQPSIQDTFTIKIEKDTIPSAIDSLNVQMVQEGISDSEGILNLDSLISTFTFTDSSGEPIEGLEIEIINEDSIVTTFGSTETDSSGQVRLENFISPQSPPPVNIEEISGSTDSSEIEQRIQNLLDNSVSTKVINQGYFCAEYVTKTFNYVFGGGKSYLLGVVGDAWDFPSSMISLGGERIYDGRKTETEFIDYDSLKTGDILGFKKYSNQPIRGALRDVGYSFQRLSNVEGEGFTHVGLYLGERNGKHMIAHQIGEEVYTHRIEDFIFEGSAWSIYQVLRPNQKNLYISPEEYIEENNLLPIDYIVKSGDSLGKVSSSFTRNLELQNAIQWLIVSQKKRETLYVGEKLRVYSTNFDFSSTELRKGLEFLKDINAKTSSELSYWEQAIENGFDKSGLEKTSENYAIVLTILEKESSFNENPPLNMEIVCSNADSFLAKMWCNLYPDKVAKIKTEKDYVLYGPNKYKPLSSVGAMQISVDLALHLAEKEGKTYTEKEMYEYLFTKKGGVEYGIKYLKKIIDVYAPNGEINTENLGFIFADYNSGLYKSRNAAFQKKVNEIIKNGKGQGKYEDIDFLNTDGSLGDKTAKVLEKIYNIDVKLSEGKIADSESESFETSQIYNLVNPNEYAIIPQLELTSMKYGGDLILSVEKYVESSKKFFDNYCNRMKFCSLETHLA